MTNLKLNNTINIATWNVNSIRTRLNILGELIKSQNIDVLLLQEIKCQDKDFPHSEILSLGMNYLTFGQKSYNGVAILSKFPLELELKHLPLYDLNATEEDSEARYIEATFTANEKFFRVASIYVPMGGSELNIDEKLENSKRFLYKINFYKRLQKRILEITKFGALKDEYVILGGDFNVAKNEIDLHSPKTAFGDVGFHPMEIKELENIIALGLKDTFRILHPDKKNEYTWWDYRTKAFDRNLGWRLDYMLCNENVINHLDKCYTDIEIKKIEKNSDHAPVIVCVR